MNEIISSKLNCANFQFQVDLGYNDKNTIRAEIRGSENLDEAYKSAKKIIDLLLLKSYVLNNLSEVLQTFTSIRSWIDLKYRVINDYYIHIEDLNALFAIDEYYVNSIRLEKNFAIVKLVFSGDN